MNVLLKNHVKITLFYVFRHEDGLYAMCRCFRVPEIIVFLPAPVQTSKLNPILRHNAATYAVYSTSSAQAKTHSKIGSVRSAVINVLITNGAGEKICFRKNWKLRLYL